MKHPALWIASILAPFLALLAGCGGTTLASHTETISVADELFTGASTSFASAGPIDPPDFGDTGPLDIKVTAAKARYTIENRGETPAHVQLFISEKSPAEINAGNVKAEAIPVASLPPEGDIPPGGTQTIEGQDILNPTLRQFLENDRTFYFYALATASGGSANVRVTGLEVEVRAEVQL
jgi:hypothetical protein